MAVANHPLTTTIQHFDERACGFYALGLAKVSGQPAAVVTTSATAAANLLPAILEAFYAGVPLLVLTADRPPELRELGVNQTVDQLKLFGNHVRLFRELPCPDGPPDLRAGALMLAQAVCLARSFPKGPVHLNCPFREPLFSQTSLPTPLLTAPKLEPALPHITTHDIWATCLASFDRGALLVGELPPQAAHAIYDLADALQWPILADPLSNLRNERVTRYASLFADRFPIDAVLHLGGPYVSKSIATHLARQPPPLYLLVSNHASPADAAQLVTHRLTCDPTLFCRTLLTYLPKARHNPWLSEWQNASLQTERALRARLASSESLSEPTLCLALPSGAYSLFIGNSMPIRNLERFFFPTHSSPWIFGNRGCSGIDGNIATAIGIASASARPTLAILGDLACLHDINSLSLLSQCPQPVIILVINNGGGGIFSFLPIAQQTDRFETHFAGRHSWTFASAAALFDLPYAHPNSTTELHALLSSLLEQPTHTLIEITTSREEAVTLQGQIETEVQEALCSVTLTKA